MNSISRDYFTAIKSFEAVHKPACDKDRWRPRFHIMPPVGWLNDPNGLCWFRGNYHVYFQYSPFDPQGGMKCWGLYTSPNLVNWTYQGVSLCPDESFDVHGVYSGSALAEGEEMRVYYTGNVKKTGDYNYITDGREGNTICARSRDGIHFEQKQLLMTNDDYGMDLTCHVRDPKVWKENGQYYMVQGARTKEDVGVILLFRSKDGIEWEKAHVLTSEAPFGYMWECPDLFTVDGQRVLCFSPQGVEAEEDRYQNVYQSVWCLADENLNGCRPLSGFEELDHGFDYYASQSFQSPDGRRIQIAWMGLPDIQGIYENPTVESGWQHAMTIPRELHVRDGRLFQTPVVELKSMRKTGRPFSVEGSSMIRVEGIFELEWKRERGDEEFQMELNQDVVLSYHPEGQKFELCFLNHTGAGRAVRRAKLDSLEELRIYMDTSSLEIFLNGGAQVFTTRYYPDSHEWDIHMKAPNGQGIIWNL